MADHALALSLLMDIRTECTPTKDILLMGLLSGKNLWLVIFFISVYFLNRMSYFNVIYLHYEYFCLLSSFLTIWEKIERNNFWWRRYENGIGKVDRWLGACGESEFEFGKGGGKISWLVITEMLGWHASHLRLMHGIHYPFFRKW